ncbi:hypothetical protein [Niabella sp.]|uniref:hypothetical protein n=1 Tax=Niabella sp. TaxID=1962976 RepID=UPI002633F41F|nr:hypothetical protein [Niabella sp.]
MWYILLILLYILVVSFGIRLVLLNKVLPAHLKVLGIIVILIFNIIPVGLYVLLNAINTRNK